VVDFVVTLTEDGTYVLVATSASGAVLSTQTVTVSDHGAVLVAGASATVGGQLSYTGFQGMGLAAGGGVLVLMGTGLVLVSQRPRVSRVTKP